MTEKKYDIFISWHDDQHDTEMPYSKAVALEYKRFIELVFGKRIRVFDSAVDAIGSWRLTLSDSLQDCNYAIFVITDKAIKSGWLHAEYGAFTMKTIIKDLNKYYANLFPVVEFRDEEDVCVTGPIKELKVYYPVHKDSIEGNTYKSQFKKLLELLPLYNEDVNISFDKYFEMFRKRIQYCKDHGTKNYKSIDWTIGYRYSDINTMAASSAIVVSESVDDIVFDKIEFNYKTLPENNYGDKKVFYGRSSFLKDLHDEFAKGNNCLNVVAAVGMGKTSVAHMYIKMFKNDYENRILFVTSNTNLQDDFNKTLRDCILVNNNSYDKYLQKSSDCLTKQIVRILNKATKKSLLIIDVNIDDEHLKALDLADIKESEYWNILYLSRKKIDGAKQSDKFALPNFENDLDGATGLFDDIYKDNGFDEDQHKHLFGLVYHHPLLIEQLAAYGIRDDKRKSYKELCDVLKNDVMENDATDTEEQKGIWLVDKHELLDKDNCGYNIYTVLSKQISYTKVPEECMSILRQFISCQNNYLSAEEIKTDRSIKIEKLKNLMILYQFDKGYCMHGIWYEIFKKQLLCKDDIDNKSG